MSVKLRMETLRVWFTVFLLLLICGLPDKTSKKHILIVLRPAIDPHCCVPLKVIEK